MFIYTSVNQDHLKTKAQKNKNNPILLNTRNIFVTVLNMLFTFPFILSFSFLQVSSFVCFSDKSKKKEEMS